MGGITRFEEIKAWQKSKELALVIYKVTSRPPFSQDFALKDQIRRSAISSLSNISEGFERGGNKEFFQFLAIAKGSVGEIRAQLYIAAEQQYIEDDEFQEIYRLTVETSSLISGFMKYLSNTSNRGSKYK